MLENPTWVKELAEATPFVDKEDASEDDEEVKSTTSTGRSSVEIDPEPPVDHHFEFCIRNTFPEDVNSAIRPMPLLEQKRVDMVARAALMRRKLYNPPMIDGGKAWSAQQWAFLLLQQMTPHILATALDGLPMLTAGFKVPFTLAEKALELVIDAAKGKGYLVLPHELDENGKRSLRATVEKGKFSVQEILKDLRESGNEISASEERLLKKHHKFWTRVRLDIAWCNNEDVVY